MLELKEQSCGRCGAPETTFVVKKIQQYEVKKHPKSFDEYEYLWHYTANRDAMAEEGFPVSFHEVDIDYEYRYDAFCICILCKKSTVFILEPLGESKHAHPSKYLEEIPGLLQEHGNVVERVSLNHFIKHRPLEHVPENIKSAFEEGDTCLAAECFNAACGEFRSCLDLATKDKFRELSAEKNTKVVDFLQENKKPFLPLQEKLDFLFDNSFYPEHLRTAADCVKLDGNDGLHDGGLGKADAESSLDGIYRMLQHLYTIPAKDTAATERITARRAKNKFIK